MMILGLQGNLCFLHLALCLCLLLLSVCFLEIPVFLTTCFLQHDLASLESEDLLTLWEAWSFTPRSEPAQWV